MWFTRVSLRNPVFATMMMLALVVLGLFSLQRLKVDQFPNVDFPVVVVTAEYPGAAPEIVETEVTRRLEDALGAIAGINALTSRSYEGQAVVIVEFQLHVDGRRAADEVREKVALVRPLLRTEVKEPKVQRFDPSSRPIWAVAVLPDAQGGAVLSPLALTQWAEQTLKKRLETVRGVGAVQVVGGTRREITIEPDPVAMEAYGVTLDQLLAAVRGENQDAPLGPLRAAATERLVRVDARVQRPEDFLPLVVARRGAQGTPVRLAQVARVRDGAAEAESLALYNGQPTLLVQVQKAQDENTLDVVAGLRREVAAMSLPAGLRLEPVNDSARPIRTAVDNVRRTLIEGAVLTVLIVWLFLNSWRSTVITGLTLPIALIGTFAFMYAFGFTVNMITLMALSLCVGLLIDDAIVVRENIVRHVQMGKGAYQAALDGTQEIGLAVLATTLSIVAVFLPIGFMGGIIGKFFHEFGITMVAAVLISMFVAFTLDPMLSSVWHDPEIDPGARDGAAGRRAGLYQRTLGRVTHGFERFTDRLADGYQALLRWSLAHRGWTVAGAVGTFVLSLALLRLVGTEFVPTADFGETTLNFHTPPGSSLQLTEAKARQVDAIVRQLPEVRYTVMTINAGDAQGKNNVSVYVRLVDRRERQRGVTEVSAELRQRLARVAGITVTHVGLRNAVGGNKQIEFFLQGPDLAELDRLAREVQGRLRAVPGLVDLDSSARPAKPVVALQVRRDVAADLGLSVVQIATALRPLLAGQTVGNWRADDDQTYDVTVRLAPADRSDPAQIARIGLTAGMGADGQPRIVRVEQVARLRETEGVNQINRRDLTREVAFSANALGRSAGEVSADIRRALEGLAMPDGYRWQFGGSTQNMQESFAYAVQALAMGVIFIYMVLASQFRSFAQPLALMTSLPLTLIGVVLALLMFRSTLSLFSVIGVVLLMGLVTKNAILLVDFANRARAGGIDVDGRPLPPQPLNEALLLAARVRLRPILMTTLAMVFGMVPLAFALTEGSEQRAPMGQAVIGGVITSSLLTLVVVPVAYAYIDDAVRWLRGLRGGRSSDTVGTGSLPRISG